MRPNYPAGLHMHKQAVLVILVIKQHEIADILRLFPWRKFRMPDLPGLGILKPVFRNVICNRENNASPAHRSAGCNRTVV
jgi:hypothetical protein